MPLRNVPLSGDPRRPEEYSSMQPMIFWTCKDEAIRESRTGTMRSEDDDFKNNKYKVSDIYKDVDEDPPERPSFWDVRRLRR